eukprot:5099953-Amphidinium_carterae.2
MRVIDNSLGVNVYTGILWELLWVDLSASAGDYGYYPSGMPKLYPDFISTFGPNAMPPSLNDGGSYNCLNFSTYSPKLVHAEILVIRVSVTSECSLH